MYEHSSGPYTFMITCINKGKQEHLNLVKQSKVNRNKSHFLNSHFGLRVSALVIPFYFIITIILHKRYN